MMDEALRTAIVAILGALVPIVSAKLAPDSFGRLFTKLLFAGQERENKAVDIIADVLRSNQTSLTATLDKTIDGWRESTTNFARLSGVVEGSQRDEQYRYEDLKSKADGQIDRLDEIKIEVSGVKGHLSDLVQLLAKGE